MDTMVYDRIRKHFTERFQAFDGKRDAGHAENGELTEFYFKKSNSKSDDILFLRLCRMRVENAGLGVDLVGTSYYLSDDPNIMAVVVRFGKNKYWEVVKLLAELTEAASHIQIVEDEEDNYYVNWFKETLAEAKQRLIGEF